MSNQVPLSVDEKRCLALATTFLNEAMDQTHFTGNRLLGATTIAAAGSMLGDLAADKFRDCERETRQPALPARHR